MARSQRTKLALKDLGEPAMVKTLPEKDKAKGYFMGTLIGVVTGIVSRKNPKDDTEVFEGLAGTFRAIPSDTKRDEIESGVLFIPDAFHNMIVAPFKVMQATDKNSVLNFAFEVTSIPAANPIGYSWQFTPLAEPDAENPLDAILNSLGKLNQVGETRRLQLAPPEKAAPAAAKK